MSLHELERLAFLSATLRNPAKLLKRGGRIIEIGPDFFRASGLQEYVSVHDRLEYESATGTEYATVLTVTSDGLIAAPFSTTHGMKIGDPVFISSANRDHSFDYWLGRVVDPLARPIDGKGPLRSAAFGGNAGQRILPVMGRQRVNRPLKTGIRAIDIFTPLCFGQRMGIFAGSGVGKSTLLGMLTNSHSFDCVVVALVGERGREVLEFLDDSIGEAARAKTVAIVATSDESALMRFTAPKLAIEAASHFRAQGRNVLLLMDSVTRFAHATREIASASGEPPVLRGYPAAVFAELPKLLEAAGPGLPGSGTTTAIITVLVDGDDHNEPISDAVRGILDGHIILDREIANQGRYPPINLLSSISRLAPVSWSPEQRVLVQQMKSLIARYEETVDLRLLGSWQPGVDEHLDKAVATVPAIYAAMNQSPHDPKAVDAFSELLRFLKGETAPHPDQASADHATG